MDMRENTDILVDINNTQPNRASQVILRACNSDFNRSSTSLQNDVSNALGGNCVYLPHFLCHESDLTLFHDLEAEIQLFSEQEVNNESAGKLVEWSKHMKHENPEFSPTFQRVIATISAYFDVEVYASRLNYYPDGGKWKPFHKDSHAYAKNHEGSQSHKEDFTVGCSFGAQRSLAFLHEKSGVKFTFPQKNGDLFAFSSEVNEAFLHGVPKATETVGKRFSIIAWGRRKKLNARNSTLRPEKAGPLPSCGNFNLQDVMQKVRDARLDENRHFCHQNPFKGTVTPKKNQIYGGRLQ